MATVKDEIPEHTRVMAKEMHNMYQALIDEGFTEDRAASIVQEFLVQAVTRAGKSLS